LWNEEIPARTDQSLAPQNYFESLLSPKDRFSWIQENFIELMAAFSGVSMEAGYDFNLVGIENSSDVIGYITYVKPHSPASRSSLKRGDFFLTVNGTQLTRTNYLSLIEAMSFAHELGIAVDFPYSPQTESIFLPVEKYEENPILLDTIYQFYNKKIGYIVYNFFAPDNGDGSISYEKELNDIFGRFQGVDDLILDLRYNGGGFLSTAISLASMISKRTENDIFAIELYNNLLDRELKREYGSGYNQSYFTESLKRRNERNEIVETIPVNHLGLNKLHVITSRGTASASEILINALRPYIDVVIIGDSTTGKNVGSITLYEEDPEKQKTNQWGLQPIVVKFANKDGFSGYENGFAPDIEAWEIDADNLVLLPLGDTDELLLQQALFQVSGYRLKSKLGNAGKFRPIASSANRIPARENIQFDFRRVRK
jgi:C-terminal processing protease CtpA/Prc